MCAALTRQSTYLWYLGTAFWRERRERCMKRAKGTCEWCKKRRATQVHHLTYMRVFNELPTDLVALCDPCHRNVHQLKPANDNQIAFEFSMPDEYEDTG
jgi:hypothetical protein